MGVVRLVRGVGRRVLFNIRRLYFMDYFIEIVIII